MASRPPLEYWSAATRSTTTSVPNATATKAKASRAPSRRWPATARCAWLIVLHGGYLPATAGNPQPYGMPPFRQSLSDDDVADVLSFIREAWGNGAPPVDIVSVHRARERSGS